MVTTKDGRRRKQIQTQIQNYTTVVVKYKTSSPDDFTSMQY